MPDRDEAELLTKMVLRLHATNLPRNGIRKTFPDTYAIVTSLEGEKEDGSLVMREHGRTEVIKNNCRPQWITTFPLRYKFGSECKFIVQLFRKCKDDDNEGVCLGKAVFEVGDVLGSKNQTKIKRLPKGGIIFCRIEPVQKAVQNLIFRFRFSACITVRRNYRGAFSAFSTAPDTILQIAKQHPDVVGWVAVYRSSPVENSLTPTWDVGRMDVESLCNGNWDRPLRLAVLEYRKKAPGLLLGECETTLRTILNTQRDTHSTRSAEDASMHGFELRRDMTQLKPIGRLQVRLAQVMDIFNRAATDCTSIIDDDSSTELDDIDVFAPSTPLAKLPTAIAALPTPMAAPATFQDYIKSGWRLDFYVAIDLTSSNGDPRIPGTLHYQNPTALNDYEETIVSIGTAIAPYTVGESMATTVWGFGCKFDGVVRHIFQCGSENPVYGVDGILRAYKAVFMSDLTMSGPTCLDQVLQAAAVQARKHQQAQVPVYSVLLIITDGISQDLQETKRKMEMYSSLPLSVLIVGVGRADFGSMHELASFSNVTVCEFRQHQHDPRSLGKGVLKHLPGQILQYMRRNKISSRRS